MEINIKHRFRKEDSQIFNDFSFLLGSSAVNNAQEIEFENAISAIYLFYGEEKTVTIVHGNMEMGYQEELNQVAGLLEADILSKNVPCYKKCCLGLTKKAFVYCGQKNYPGRRYVSSVFKIMHFCHKCRVV